MFTTVYASNAVFPFSDADIHKLLVKSRVNNESLDVTGLLLYKQGRFMQALEGEESVVRALIAIISQDPRHKRFWTISEEHTAARQFPDWSMGYWELTDEELRAIPGYSQFFDEVDDDWVLASRSKWLLDWFRTNAVD